MELINTVGTRVRVRDEHAEHLLAAGYTHPDSSEAEQQDRPTRRTTARATRRTTTQES